MSHIRCEMKLNWKIVPPIIWTCLQFSDQIISSIQHVFFFVSFRCVYSHKTFNPEPILWHPTTWRLLRSKYLVGFGVPTSRGLPLKTRSPLIEAKQMLNPRGSVFYNYIYQRHFLSELSFMWQSSEPVCNIFFKVIPHF